MALPVSDHAVRRLRDGRPAVDAREDCLQSGRAAFAFSIKVTAKSYTFAVVIFLCGELGMLVTRR